MERKRTKGGYKELLIQGGHVVTQAARQQQSYQSSLKEKLAIVFRQEVNFQGLSHWTQKETQINNSNTQFPGLLATAKMKGEYWIGP